MRHHFAELHLFQRDCKNKFVIIFTQTNAISKRKKIEIPDWRQMKEFFKGLKMVSFFYFEWRNQSFKSASFFLIRVVCFCFYQKTKWKDKHRDTEGFQDFRYKVANEFSLPNHERNENFQTY